MTGNWVREGRSWAFGDEVSIEYISPLRFMISPEGRGANCLRYLDANFAAAEKSGDLIVAGTMFGQGPGHDHAILAIKEAGIVGVIARSFAPQFFRHAIGHGLLVAECDSILDEVAGGDRVAMDFATGRGANVSTGATISATVPIGPAMEIITAGGLVPYLREYLATGASRPVSLGT
jgi:3-isopropylmalate/(R)-2-methylmalate dehydratase small subunit